MQGSLKWPESSLLLYLFLATLPCDILSGFLVFCDRVVYSVFLSSPRSFGLSPLEDQQCAGALLWTCVTVVYLIAGAVFTARLLSPHRSEEFVLPQSDARCIALRHTNPHRMEVVLNVTSGCNYRAFFHRGARAPSCGIHATPRLLALTKPEVNFLILITLW
jgi:hypothetical protein